MKAENMKVLIKMVTAANANPEYRQRKNYVRPPIVFHGPAGSAKTKTVEEAGTDMKIPVINVRLGQEPPEDMSYPEIQTRSGGVKTLTKIIAEMMPRELKDENGYVMRREIVDGEIVETEDYAVDYESIANYIDNFDAIKEHYDNLGLSINDAPGGILFLDEVNRIDDKAMFQMIFQVFDSGKFKGYKIPSNISLFAACNPTKGYIVSNWFDDPAFENRCIHIKTQFEEETWFDFASQEDSGYTPLEIELARTNTDVLFDDTDNDFEIPKLHRSYRNMSFLSNLVGHIDWKDHPDIETELVRSILGETFVGHYFNVKEKIARRAIEPEDIFNSYDEYDLGEDPFLSKTTQVNGKNYTEYFPNTVFDHIYEQKTKSAVRETLLDQIDKGRQDYVTKVVDSLTKHILKNMGDKKTRKEFEIHFDKNRLRFLRFMLDLPRGTYPVFIRGLLSPKENKVDNIITKSLITPIDRNNKKSVESALAMKKIINKIDSDMRNTDEVERTERM